MNRRRLEALERVLIRPRPTCPCLLTFCPDEGETKPALDVVCDRCGQWRDAKTTRVIQLVVVNTRDDVEQSRANARRSEP